MNLLTLSLIFNLCLIKSVLTFNLSPRPNRNLTVPKLNFYPPKFESSYFGYQINLRKSNVIVSAPRGQTTFWSQSKFNESGSLYKCKLHGDGECIIWNVDDSDGRSKIDGYTQIKSKQWLGAAMDGGSSDDDLFTVCAPNVVSVKYDPDMDYYTHGKCYLIENFSYERIKPFQPLSKSDHQVTYIKQYGKMVPFTHFYYGQMGASIQMFNNQKEYIILIGAPGLLTGCGGVVRWRSHTTRKRTNLINAFEQFDVSDPIVLASNSYFGYAVAIGNFLSKNRITYAASAPRAGFVNIFSFNDNIAVVHNYKHRLRKGQAILGEQLGEYFGYAMLADDFNNDKFTDLAIGAPMYSKQGTHENGKVYIYNCKALVCQQGLALFSNYNESGRFGMSFGKIGDINRDGYNDLAVGAPYEGRGKVYIFLGGPNGLSPIPSQIISAPVETQTFGLGLSKGVDIDGNNYNDLVIGAPDSEAAFIYKSYPIVKISTIISPRNDKVSITDRETVFNVCVGYDTPTPSFNAHISIGLTLNLDPQLKRATFAHSQKHSETIDLAITKHHNQTCRSYRIELNHSALIQLPILLEARYKLKKDFRQSKEFCTDCVAINPSDPKIKQVRIAIRSGCKDDQWCMANLIVKSNLTAQSLTHILGKPELITIEYVIKNVGETAYFPKISVSLSPTTRFAKLLPNCYVDETILHCHLLNSIPLYRNNETKCLVTIRPVDLAGDKLTIEAVVSTSSNDTNPNDNTLVNTIDLVEYSFIEIIGKSYPPQLSIDEDDTTGQLNIIHEFVIINYGYSTMNEIIFTAQIPLIYNNTYILIDHIEIGTDREEFELEDELSIINSDETNFSSGHRAKRETLANIKDEAFQNRIVEIPHHRAKYFNCSATVQIHICNTTILRLNNFIAKETIKVILNMTLNIEYLQKILNKTHNMLLFEVIPLLEKVNSPNRETYKLTAMNTLTVIELITEEKTPLIWIIVSIIVGILVLCGIIYWFNRMGFFRRTLKREIIKIKRETMQIRQSMALRPSVQFTELDEEECEDTEYKKE